MLAVPVPRPHGVAVGADQIAFGDLGLDLFDRVVAIPEVEQLRSALGHVVPFQAARREIASTVRAWLARFHAGDVFAADPAEWALGIRVPARHVALVAKRWALTAVSACFGRFPAWACEVTLGSWHASDPTVVRFELRGLASRNGFIPFTRNGFQHETQKG